MKIKSIAVALISFVLLAPTLQIVSANVGSVRVEDGVAVAPPQSTVASGLSSPLPQAASMPSITLQAASGVIISFMTQNGEVKNNISPQPLDLPHLVLYRNGTLTDPDERTLNVTVFGIEVSPTGVTVTLELETQHGNPDHNGGFGNGIPVLRTSQWITNTWDFTQTGVTAVFSHEFKRTVISGTEAIPTPTDYFRYDITVMDDNHPITNPVHTFSGDYAFLMENQWTAPLPGVQEQTDSAPPDELVIFYCDMIPFWQSIQDATTWLLREDVTEYVQTELVPEMIQAFQVQTKSWGFPWSSAWTSYRPGKDTERLSVALSDGLTWFHGKAPSQGHSEISIKINGGYYADYGNLTDGLMSIFQHELFHNLQRNINQNNGGDGDVDGKENAWQFFSEGMAVLASSVGQPDVQFTQTKGARSYTLNANKYIGSGGVPGGELNSSYEEMSPYHAAIYWRFLYEQCGGMKNGVEDPAAGMQVINHALMELYSKEIVDISSSTDLVGKLPEIMDRVLKVSSCPFKTYEESLSAFARAIYALRLEGGRCTEPGIPAGCGYYDPNNLYQSPPVSTVTYTGADQRVSDRIKSSFGMDFIEVEVDSAADGSSLTIEFHGTAGTEAEFNVEIWKLVDSEEKAKPQRISTQLSAAEILTSVNEDGHLSYVISEIDTTEYNRLGLIITRLDTNESSNSTGEYTIVLHSNAG